MASNSNDHFLTDIPVLIVGLVAAYICILANLLSGYKLFIKLEQKKTFFYFVMWAIIILSLLSSLLFASQVVCDSKDMKKQYCSSTIAKIMWIISYTALLALLQNAVNKYQVVMRICYWKIDFSIVLRLVGTLVYTSLLISRLMNLEDIEEYLVLVFLLYVYILDASMEIILLRKIWRTRSQCFDVPTRLRKAYFFAKHSIVAYVLVIPVAVVLLLIAKENPNLFNLFKYLIYLLLNVHIYFNVTSMIFICKLGSLSSIHSKSPQKASYDSFIMS